MLKKLLITDIEPGAIENLRNIRTAYLFVKVNNGMTLKAFVPDWYDLGFEGMSLEEIKSSLIGKEANVELHLTDLNLNIKKKSLSPLNISQLNNNAEIAIVGEVINLRGPFIHRFSQDGKLVNYEYFCVDLDCGVAIIEISMSKSEVRKSNLQIGDYIEADGRLDIIVDKILDKEKQK